VKKEAECSNNNAQKGNGALKGHGAKSIKGKKKRKRKECVKYIVVEREAQCSRTMMRLVSH
jgi:hypothetical protein